MRVKSAATSAASFPWSTMVAKFSSIKYTVRRGREGAYDSTPHHYRSAVGPPLLAIVPGRASRAGLRDPVAIWTSSTSSSYARRRSRTHQVFAEGLLDSSALCCEEG